MVIGVLTVVFAVGLLKGSRVSRDLVGLMELLQLGVGIYIVAALEQPAHKQIYNREIGGLGRKLHKVGELEDLAAEEDQGDDRDDRDEGEDQRVLRETLAFLVPAKRDEESVEQRHVAASWMSTHPQMRAGQI